MGRPKPDTRSGSFLIAIAAWVFHTVCRAVGRSCWIDVVSGQEHLDALLGEPLPVLISFWHNRIFLGSDFVFEHLHRQGLEITILASKSRDGEVASRIAKRWGLHTVRGSASRGGGKALRALYRAVTRKKTSPVMIPDGPRGPIYHFKIGVAVLAQMSQTPILPMGFAAEKFWRVKSWDRLIVPRPFTRITLAVGEPQHLARSLSQEELEAERERLQGLLDDLTLEAEAAAGVEDTDRPA